MLALSWQKIRYVRTVVACAVMACAALTGCSGAGGLSPAVLDQPPSGASGPRWSLVTLQGIAGAPPGFTQQLTRALNALAQDKAIALLVDPALNADLRLEGIVSLSREKSKDGRGTLRYAWIVRDNKGVAIQTVDGVDAVKLPVSDQDPWNWIPTSTVATMADRALTALAPHLQPSDIGAGVVASAPKQ